MNTGGGPALVITSISRPNKVLKKYADKCRKKNIPFYLVGDIGSPADFALDGCQYFGIEQQKKLHFRLAGILPVKHYSRKNLGYLLAMENHPDLIAETDDDNEPYESFWDFPSRDVEALHLVDPGWINIYSYFSETGIWPRGFPLDQIRKPAPAIPDSAKGIFTCPVQQYLADENPDVDAVYRLTAELPVKFRKNTNIALGRNGWCPFNSQNTIWFPEAFPLMYLPSYCSFRMTDIWRSLVARRICREYGWCILFSSPTVRQDRNEHKLMQDFYDEIPGYMNNAEICEKLDKLNLKPGTENIFENMILCYEVFFSMHLIDTHEIRLLEFWREDYEDISKNR